MSEATFEKVDTGDLPKPIGARVLVSFEKGDKKLSSGLIIPQVGKGRLTTEGIVEAIGFGDLDDAGHAIPMEVKVGDRVIFNKYAGTEVRANGKNYLMLFYKDIDGIVADAF